MENNKLGALLQDVNNCDKRLRQIEEHFPVPDIATLLQLSKGDTTAKELEMEWQAASKALTDALAVLARHAAQQGLVVERVAYEDYELGSMFALLPHQSAIEKFNKRRMHGN